VTSKVTAMHSAARKSTVLCEDSGVYPVKFTSRYETPETEGLTGGGGVAGEGDQGGGVAGRGVKRRGVKRRETNSRSIFKPMTTADGQGYPISVCEFNRCIHAETV